MWQKVRPSPDTPLGLCVAKTKEAKQALEQFKKQLEGELEELKKQRDALTENSGG